MAHGRYQVVNVHFSPGFTVVNVDLLAHRQDRARPPVPSWVASGAGQSGRHGQPVQPVQTPYFGHCSLPPRQVEMPSSLQSIVEWETFRRARGSSFSTPSQLRAGLVSAAFRLWLRLGQHRLLLFDLLLLLLGDALALVGLVGTFFPKCRYADELGPIVRIGQLTCQRQEILGLAAIVFRTHQGHSPFASSNLQTVLTGKGSDQGTLRVQTPPLSRGARRQFKIVSTPVWNLTLLHDFFVQQAQGNNMNGRSLVWEDYETVASCQSPKTRQNAGAWQSTTWFVPDR